MKRVGIIIGVPDSPHGRLPGVEVDLEHYRRFLGSLGGGAWEPSEVQILRNPNRKDALQAVQAAQNFDYGFVVFSGHGYHGVGASLSETVVCLTGNDEARISELFPRVRRSLVIADCCRKEVPLAANVQEQLLASAAFANERRTLQGAFFAIRPHAPFLFDGASADVPNWTTESGKMHLDARGLGSLLPHDSSMKARGIHGRGAESSVSEILSSRFLTGVADRKGQI